MNSGIALDLLREHYPASMVVTPAGLLTALADLGPRPPWWRPFARRRWRAMRDFVLLNYGRPTFANIAKAPPGSLFVAVRTTK